jgi:hypothetical protein
VPWEERRVRAPRLAPRSDIRRVADEVMIPNPR